MSDPTTSNPTVSIAGQINSVIFEAVVVSVETYAEAQIPLLAAPVLKQIFEFIVEKIAGLLEEQLQTFVAFTIIDLGEASKNQAYKQAVSDLQIALHKGDPNGITQAKASFKDTFSTLVHWSGS